MTSRFIYSFVLLGTWVPGHRNPGAPELMWSLIVVAYYDIIFFGPYYSTYILLWETAYALGFHFRRILVQPPNVIYPQRVVPKSSGNVEIQMAYLSHFPVQNSAASVALGSLNSRKKESHGYSLSAIRKIVVFE